MIEAVLGVDISKAKMDVALWQPQVRKWHARRTGNDAVSARQLVGWACDKASLKPTQLRVVVEATGPYHEIVAEAFHAAGCEVVIANPKRVRDFAKGNGWLTKTDTVDARALARYGSDVDELQRWIPPPDEVRVLRALAVRLDALEQDLRRETNRLEKAQATITPPVVLESLQRGIAALRRERDRLLQEINDHIDRHPGLKQDRALLESIPGIGSPTAVRLLCLLRSRPFDSARQAAACAGLAVVLSESGATVRSNPRLSKQGSPRLRAGLYFPAIVASKHNPALKVFYQRLRARGKTKMSALGALMRKLVHIAYGVLKHQTPFQPQLAVKFN